MEKVQYTGRLDNYSLGRKIGAGCSSKVREGFSKQGKFAVKYLALKATDALLSTTYSELVYNEAKVMSQLNHPNIVKLYEFGDKKVIEKANGKKIPVLYLVLELVTGGELFDYVALTGRFSDKLARHYFKQLIEALEFMHSKGFAHRDIKAENLLLDSDYALKLADFGFSAEIVGKDGSGTLKTYKGTSGYMAPEINMGQNYSGQKVDYFAVGVLLFIMIAQHPPFKKAMVKDQFYKLFCYQNERFWEGMAMHKPAGIFSEDLKSLINRLLSFNPVLRPSISEIKSHPWYNGPDMTEEEIKEEFRIRRQKVEIEWKAKEAKALEKKLALKNEETRRKAAIGINELNPPQTVSTRLLVNHKNSTKILSTYKVTLYYLNRRIYLNNWYCLRLKNLKL